MKPALLEIPQIDSYSVLLLLGFFFGWLLARSRRGWFGIQGSDLDNISLILPIAGLFGARFFARLFYEKVPFFDAIQVWKGDGLVFYGGFLFGILAVLIYGLLRRINLVKLADCLAPSVALGLAFGRVGCFLAGCCWGDMCATPAQLAALHDPVVLSRVQTIPAISSAQWPMAVAFPAGSEAAKQHRRLGVLEPGAVRSLPVHPVQLYEAALAAALCLLLHLASRGRASPGSTSIALLLGYAFIRFCTEFLRADNKIYAWDFTFSQVVSMWIGVFCVLLLLARRLTFPVAARGGEVPYKPRPASG